ncbi:MAG: alanine:cation symporter family protein [Clostridia bacterium]|nr:alanine:cation symporter family protein [Clostridia bacterium]
MWDKIIAVIEKVNNAVNGVVWGWPMIILILGTGLLLTIRTKVLQVRKFGDSVRSTIVPTIKSIGKKQKKEKKENSISQFEAFCSAISGTVGTGNIIGTTSAILTGGPGAVFWMWISAFFGMVTNYGENVLGLYYRKKDKKGNFSGGAFWYIDRGLGWKWLGYIAAVFCMIAAVGMSGVQTNKISSTIAGSLNTTMDPTMVKLIIGIVVAVITALVIIGGIKRIGKVASILVPFMTIIFLALSITGIFMNVTAIPEAFSLIFKNIFGYKAAVGGIAGYAFAQVIQKGMARGVFSNEAGLGSSVIAHSASETREPVKQGLWGVFEVFLDTFVICTITALVVLTTNISNGALFESMAKVQAGESGIDTALALSTFTTNFGTFGTVCFCTILPLFAFTTIIAWSYYGEKATEYCFQGLKEKGQKISILIFKIIFVLLIVASAVIHGELIWAIDDTFNGLMALPNLIAVILLSGTIVKLTKNYYDRKKGLQVKPMLSADEEQNEEFIKDIENGMN